MTNFTQRVGIVHASDAAWRRAIGAATLTRRLRRGPWCSFVFRLFFAAKLFADYADSRRGKKEITRPCLIPSLTVADEGP